LRAARVFVLERRFDLATEITENTEVKRVGRRLRSPDERSESGIGPDVLAKPLALHQSAGHASSGVTRRTPDSLRSSGLRMQRGRAADFPD